MRSHTWKKEMLRQKAQVRSAYEQARLCFQKGKRICAAGRWLLDNHYLVEQQWQAVNQEFPWKQLRRLNGTRLLEQAQEMLRQNTTLDEETLLHQMKECGDWQCEELCLLPDMMKVVCLRNIAGLSKQISVTQTAYALAQRQEQEKTQGNQTLALPELEERQACSYIECLAQQLRNHGRQALLEQLEQKLNGRGTSLETLRKEEYEWQANCGARMGEAVRALISIRSIDWREIFSIVSPVEQTLLRDPAEIYSKMDLDSRNIYLDEVVQLAKSLKVSDQEVAARVLALAQQGPAEEQRHVGYYLVGEGRKELAGPERRRAGGYIALICFLTALFTAAAGFWIRSWIPALLLLLPLSQVAVFLAQIILRRAGRRHNVVKMDIDLCSETPAVLVTVPALIPDAARGRELLRHLQEYSYASRVPNVYFALAGDLKDAPEKTLPGDQEILQTLTAEVRRMNQEAGKEQFFYLQRRRTFLQQKQIYTGWERKRGALMELNRLIAGEENGYTHGSGTLPHIDYVITLDADTVLPYDAVKKLIGAMMHPLNQPRVEDGIVKQGYGIIKPGEVLSVEAVDRTAFTKIFAGRGGISRYAAPADFYQQTFGESIYMGKGIYDPKLFLRLLSEQVPDYRVLSHDLLEGAFVRCGYASDVSFMESYPAQYLSYTQREHRWIRGDWQLLPFLLPRFRDRSGKKQKNPLTALSRWQIIDNLRRSIVPVLQALALLLAAFTGAWKLVLGVFISLLFPALWTAAQNVFRGRQGWVNAGRTVRNCFWQFMFLAHQAYVAIDAALRTLVRLLVTKKNLLEWTTSADADRRQKNILPAYQRDMMFSTVAAVFLVVAAILRPDFWGWNLLLAVLWFAAPYAAWKLSQPKEKQKKEIPVEDYRYLRLKARKMWRYFEDYSRPATHYIPPDNIQENPPVEPADRTSPTNIGLALLCGLAAWDFGFMTKEQMIGYLQRIAGTIDRLETWNGHLYNWYDTKTLRIMPPHYISTVDSGNLAGDLVALAQGLQEAAQKPLFEKEKLREGLIDSLRLLEEDGYPVHLEEVQNESFEEFVKSCAQQLNRESESPWLKKCKAQLEAVRRCTEKIVNEEQICESCRRLAVWAIEKVERMDFRPLYDKKRGLFVIGYQEDADELTPSYYDQLASEARQTSFIAIAKGDAPVQHWNRLSRVVLEQHGKRGLASWSGTMFEYYMPRLLMRNVEGSVFDETYRFVLEAQKQYAVRRGIPWGMSESAYAKFDAAWHYQYYAFGNPQLAFKSGQGKDAVVAPYAAQLALMEAPEEAVRNLRRLDALGAEGRYGFYEAVDWTPSHQLRGRDYTIVKSYMIHHLGMGMMAMHEILEDRLMQKRFARDPRIASVDYLQQERMAEPMTRPEARPGKAKPEVQAEFQENSCVRTIEQKEGALPEVLLLSNSKFSTMVDSMGGGYIRTGDIMMTRFRALGGVPPYGTFFYCREDGGQLWSPAPLPVGNTASCQCVFTSHMASFSAEKDGIRALYEITVSPEDPLEVRKLTFQNKSEKTRKLEVTSYVEPCMMRQEADVAHMAFGKLFIRSEYRPKEQLLLAEKRPREADEAPLLFFHQLCPGENIQDVSFETSRERFVGRCRSLRDPAAAEQSLSCRQGAPVDPCLSLRCTVTLPPRGEVTLCYLSGTAASKEEIMLIPKKYPYQTSLQNVFERSLARSNVVRQYLHLAGEEEEQAMRLLAQVIYPSPANKQKTGGSQNKLGQPGLWRLGISGDLPVVLCTVQEEAVLPPLLLKIHEFWRLRGFLCDLVFLLDDTDCYHRPAAKQLQEWVEQSHSGEHRGQPGGVFCLSREELQEGEEELLRTVARAVLEGVRDLAEQMTQPQVTVPQEIKLLPGGAMELEKPQLLFWNGFGGFDRDSGEYVIWLEDGKVTPLPWVNVIAGKKLGFLASDSGSGFTYAYNSREYKLTPWSNDFVSDPPGEWFILRDAERGNSWSVTHQPARSDGVYQIRHGFGYTTYRHDAYGIQGELTVFAAGEQPAKISLMKLKNRERKSRTLDVKYHAVPVMGVSEEETGRYLREEISGGMIQVRSVYPANLPEECMTICAEGAVAGVEEWNRCDCLTLTKTIELEPDEEITIPFLLGCGEFQQWQGLQKLETAQKELQSVRGFWSAFLGKVQVETPDESLNLLLNGRLLYQTYAARMLARSGFYQTSGAFGFRDQLQDSLAMLYGNETLCRAQILKHAAKQFEEGDVQHWWHDSLSGDRSLSRGIRTKFSDDLVWLAYVTAQYVQKTGDGSILQEQIPFLTDSPLESEDERYGLAQVSGKKADLYTHCIMAVDRALRYGAHGLPLMGSGDWNDGMNRVGNQGTGESVWLGFFLYKTMEDFLPLCRRQKDEKTAARYEQEMKKLQGALAGNAWDGNWFLRAYFDNGEPLGSHKNEECKMDLIAQSWSVISNAVPLEKAEEAMRQADQYLVNRENHLIRLLSPSFNKADMDPGYIKSYLPGVRENGGQYTHAAIWYVWASAQLGDGERTAEQFALINPILHSTNYSEAVSYKAEPYAVAADVYMAEGQEGRGGWSWYTGAAGWMYSLGLEMILGIKKQGNRLWLEPVVPPSWEGFKIRYHYLSSIYEITALAGKADKKKETILLCDDGQKHQVIIHYERKKPH